MYFLAAAFIVVWAAVTLYVIYLSNRQRQLEQDLAILQEVVTEKTRHYGA